MISATTHQLSKQPLQLLTQTLKEEETVSFAPLLYIAFMACLVVILPQHSMQETASPPIGAVIADGAPIMPVRIDDSIQLLGLSRFIQTSRSNGEITLRIKSQLLFSEGSTKLGRAGKRALSKILASSNTHPDTIHLLLVPRSNTSSEFYENLSPASAYADRLIALQREMEKHTSASVSLALAKADSRLPR